MTSSSRSRRFTSEVRTVDCAEYFNVQPVWHVGWTRALHGYGLSILQGDFRDVILSGSAGCIKVGFDLQAVCHADRGYGRKKRLEEHNVC